MTDSKTRVCHVITMLELGGAQRNTLYTVSHLNRDRFDVTLVSGVGGILDPEAAGEGWKTVFMRSLVRPIHPLKDVIALGTLYAYFRRSRPHIVHTHSSKAGILGRLAAYVAGVPVIIHTFHGFGFTPGQSPAMRRLFTWIEKLCAHLSTHLIYVSEDNQKEADELRIGGHASRSLIRSGITFEEAAPAAIRETLELPADAWIVTSVGNFKPQKNPMELVRVACAAAEADPQIHVLLAGDGELRAEAEAFVAAQGRTSQIHFLGWRDDARALLAASDAFLLTSLWEGLPRALVETFAARRPAVAYAVNGVRDILVDGQNGFSITPGDVPAASEKILWLKAHPNEARAMGQRGRERVEQEFDIDRMVRQQESLYDRLMDAMPIKTVYEPFWSSQTR